MRKTFSTILAVLGGILISNAAVTLKEKKIGGKTAFDVSTSRFNLTISPARGGAITAFEDKLDKKQLIIQKHFNGLFVDHFQCQPWPGEAMETPYSYKVLKNTPQEAIIELSYTFVGKYRGNTYPQIAGVKLVKQYIIRAGHPGVICKVTINATENKSMVYGYWQQNIFQAGGSYDESLDFSFRPTVRGVIKSAHEQTGALGGGDEFIKDFNDSWSAKIDYNTKSGLVFMSDYNELKTLYDSVGNATLEMMYRTTFLPPGSSQTYTTYMVPLFGVENVMSANENIIISGKTKGSNGNGNITLSALRSYRNLKKPVTVEIKAFSVEQPEKIVNVGSVTFKSLSDHPQAKSIKFKDVGKDPLVFQYKIKYQDKAVASNDFESFHVGTYKWGRNIKTDMSTPIYIGKSRPKKIKLRKPANLVLRNKPQNQVWFIDGLLDDKYNIPGAMRHAELVRFAALRDVSYVKYEVAFGYSLSSFPYDYEKLLSYDLIVFGGMSADGLGLIGNEMLGDYMKAGGNVIVLGGPSAYGFSGMEKTEMAKSWPVEFSNKPFDFIDTKGAAITPVCKDPILDNDVPWNEKIAVRYLHKVKVKPGAKVLAKAGAHPFIVSWTTGPRKSRVVCILGAPMGNIDKSKGVPFWQWKFWPYLVRNMIWWTCKQDYQIGSQ